MASLAEIIMKQVASSTGSIDIPANVKNSVVNGLAESVLGGFTQTAAKPGGIDAIKSLLTGKTAAASSPVTQLAGNLFSKNILDKLNLGSLLSGKLSALVPSVIGKVSGMFKDQDGDGDIDLNDILLSLKGGNAAPAKSAGSLLGALGKILGR